MKFTTRSDLTARRAQARALAEADTRVILVCAGTGCIAGGSMKVYERLTELCREGGYRVRIALREEGGEDTLHFKRSGCQGFCEMGPLVEIQPEGILYTHVHPEDCEEILEKTIRRGEVIERLLYKLGTTTFRSIKSSAASFLRRAATPTPRISTNIWPTAAMKRWKRRCSK